MSAARNESMKSQEEVASLCAEIVRRIKTEEDPVSLNAYRSIMKKNVPFFMRSYFAAFLLKQLHDAVPRGERKAQPEKKRRREAPTAAPVVRREEPARKDDVPKREDTPRRVLPESEAATLFIGVGRNRRAYARDLLAFIVANAGIEADAVGELRVLDNFSFVQIRKEIAETVIENLNGAEFRGRAVSVSFAKPRKEEPKEESSSPAFEAIDEDADDPVDPDSSSE